MGNWEELLSVELLPAVGHNIECGPRTNVFLGQQPSTNTEGSYVSMEHIGLNCHKSCLLYNYCGIFFQTFYLLQQQ